MLAQLAAAHSTIVGMGAQVIGIAPAAPYQAEHLRATKVPFELFVDPDGRLARRIDLGQQSLVRYVFNLPGWWRYVKAFVRNRRQGRITASYRVHDAAMITDGDGGLVYLYRGDGLADYPTVETLLAEVAALTDV